MARCVSYSYTACAVCDDVTGSGKDPPVCQRCHVTLCTGTVKPQLVCESVRDALVALTAYRARLGLAGPAPTTERLRWCRDYLLCRRRYLDAHSGRLPPARLAPRTAAPPPTCIGRERQPPTRSPGTTRDPGP